MAVTIQDDMWACAQAMGGKQGDEFLLALLRYGFEGAEPEPRGTVWSHFVLCRDRVDLSGERHQRARAMAEARWSKQDEERPKADNSERNAQVAEVIAHLNEVCGTAYKPNAKVSREHVGARLSEGFTVEDCKRVVDNMAAKWLRDPKMRQYLRPTTLFRPEKFEGYLNQPVDEREIDFSAYEFADAEVVS